MPTRTSMPAHSDSLRVVPYSGWGSLPEAYQPVFQDAGRTSFFLSQEWFQSFVTHVVRDPGRVHIYGVESFDGAPVAALPMLWSPRPASRGAPRALESLSNYYSCYFSPALSANQDPRPVVSALAAALWSDRRRWDALTIHPVDRDSPVYDGFVRGLRRLGAVVQPYFRFGNWYLEVAGRSYQTYLDSLPLHLRRSVPYNIRRLERLPGARIEIVTGPHGLEEALDAYDSVYHASWKISEPYPAFIRELARRAATDGSLRLGLVYLHGAPVAAQMWFVHGGVASIYKMAYDERHAKLSPGSVLSAKLMQHTIDIDHVKTVDYLSGDDEHKKAWMSHRREFWGILALNPRSACGLAQIMRHVGGRALKRALLALTSS